MADFSETFYVFLRNCGYTVEQESSMTVVHLNNYAIRIAYQRGMSQVDILIHDENSSYGKYPESAIKRLFEKSFKYLPSDDFLYLGKNSFKRLNDLYGELRDCIGKYQECKERYKEIIPKLEELNMKPKHSKLRNFGKIFKNNLFLEVNKEVYEEHVREKPQGNFRDFAIFIKILETEGLHVEYYNHGENGYSLAFDVDMENDDLGSFLKNCYEKACGLSLDLIN